MCVYLYEGKRYFFDTTFYNIFRTVFGNCKKHGKTVDYKKFPNEGGKFDFSHYDDNNIPISTVRV